MRSWIERGAKPPHLRRLYRAWLGGRRLDSLHAERGFPLPEALRRDLPLLEAELGALAAAVSDHASADGSVRTLLRLADGLTVESVLLPRDGLCVSTQVGCAVGCLFCMTGREGLKRNLSAEEILAQVALGRRRRPVRRVVFMGMGEPLHNLPAVAAALDRLGHEGGFGHKNLVFSTVGDLRLFDRLLAQRVKPAVALSLHTTDGDLRARLLPRAPRVAPDALLAAAEAYARETTYPIQLQWTLLEGVNDGDDELARLGDLLQGRHAIVNFIPYNTVEGLAYRRPSWERAREMARTLHRRGVLAKLRRSAGQDVDGACGQLRARHAS